MGLCSLKLRNVTVFSNKTTWCTWVSVCNFEFLKHVQCLSVLDSNSNAQICGHLQKDCRQNLLIQVFEIDLPPVPGTELLKLL